MVQTGFVGFSPIPAMSVVSYAAGRTLRASDIDSALGEQDNTEWKPLLIDGTTNEIVVSTVAVGSR